MTDSTATTATTAVMGILNVTEDSFSDGGEWTTTGRALAHARAMVADGADIIDVGGESTRPGATRVPAELEAERVVPVIRALHAEGVTTSVDTMRASTAAAAIEAGVDIVNDVSGGLADEAMYRTVAESGVDYCLMHWRAERFESASGRADHGEDVVADVSDLLSSLASRAEHAGIDPGRIILDPGLGFAKNADDNWALLAGMRSYMTLGYRVLIGASRKRFLTALRPGPDGAPGTPESADDATAAVSALAAASGAWAVRVHNVAANRAAVDVARSVATGRGPALPEGWRARRG
ncbi:MAG: dihydropteroate synthase [Corynebacterium sp.]|uniref:dihydropteroate synthase n=1 Tax=unclassified Corynebacterium TaxID=2624378 RepID=UPI0009662601|nr:dihydropteroate synthase [Corynebacterium sp. CNJ-954]OLT50102.1 dihydropteroate synthase [Corynebacterium sp. CNJ-954]